MNEEPEVFFEGEEEELIAVVKKAVIGYPITTRQIIDAIKQLAILADDGEEIDRIGYALRETRNDYLNFRGMGYLAKELTFDFDDESDEVVSDE